MYRARSLDLKTRNYEIAFRYHMWGDYYKDLADEYGLSLRHIHRIVGGYSPPMAIPRSMLLRELLPGLDALFSSEYEPYDAKASKGLTE